MSVCWTRFNPLGLVETEPNLVLIFKVFSMRLFIRYFLKSGSPGEEKRNQDSIKRKPKKKHNGMVVKVEVFQAEIPRFVPQRLFFFQVFPHFFCCVFFLPFFFLFHFSSFIFFSFYFLIFSFDSVGWGGVGWGGGGGGGLSTVFVCISVY